MFFIVGFLDGAAAFGFVDGSVHGVGHVIGVHDDMAFAVSCGSSDSLDE